MENAELAAEPSTDADLRGEQDFSELKLVPYLNILNLVDFENDKSSYFLYGSNIILLVIFYNSWMRFFSSNIKYRLNLWQEHF